MDWIFLKNEQCFVWDADKAKANAAKHSVSFEQACSVFFDPFFVYIDASSGDEERHAAIGFSDDLAALFVVHIQMHGDVIRIISARLATAHERREHEIG